MAIRESEQQRSSQQVMSLREWAELNNISLPTARRIIERGEGPKIIRVSERCIGVRVADNLIWQQSRLRGA